MAPVENPLAKKELLQRLVLFSAEWCTPCKKVKAEIDRLGIDLKTENTDSEEGMAKYKEASGKDMLSIPMLHNYETGISLYGSESIIPFLVENFS